MVHINGKDENAAGMTIQKYLDENDYIVTHIAVECNEKIVDKSDYSSYVLKDNDVVEIVSFVGGGSGMSKDTFTLGGKEFSSRFILGSGKYSMELIKAAVENAGAQIITLAVRRTNTKKSENILDYIPEGVTLLPNTSGARDAKEAVRIARKSRELGCGDFVKIEITRLILERFGQVDAIAGVATGAIPQGALVADALNLPFVYVRSTPKDHGLENLIEGELRPGMKVVVVEDLISTGGSSLKAVEAIRRDGCEVIGMVAAYTYGFPVAEKAFKDAKVPLVTLTNYEAVLDVALRTGYIEEDDIATLNEWRKDPAHWDAGK